MGFEITGLTSLYNDINNAEMTSSEIEEILEDTGTILQDSVKDAASKIKYRGKLEKSIKKTIKIEQASAYITSSKRYAFMQEYGADSTYVGKGYSQNIGWMSKAIESVEDEIFDEIEEAVVDNLKKKTGL